MNNRTWEIVEMSQVEIKNQMINHYEKPSEEGMYFGITYQDKQIILLDKDLCLERKKETLKHELAHCYIGTFITHQNKEYNEEDVCDIVASSLEIISNIVNKYFEK